MDAAAPVQSHPAVDGDGNDSDLIIASASYSIQAATASATVTFPIEVTTFSTTFTSMSTPLNHDAAKLLSDIVDEAAYYTLSLLGYGPPLVRMRSTTKLLSQALDKDDGMLTVQIGRTLYVTIPSLNDDGTAYDGSLIPNKSVVDIATLAVFGHYDQGNMGLVSRLKSSMPDMFDTLSSVAFDRFLPDDMVVVDEETAIIVDGIDGGNGDRGVDDVRYEDNVKGMVEDKLSVEVGNAIEPTSSPTTAGPVFVPTSIPSDRATQSPTSLVTTVAPSKSPTTSVPTFHPSTQPTTVQSPAPTLHREGGRSKRGTRGDMGAPSWQSRQRTH